MKVEAKEMDFTEDDLIDKCLRRDDSGRRALYDKYSKDLYQYALRYTENEEDAKDVLQDSFILIFERISQYRRDGSLLAWMRTIVIRRAFCQYRKNIKRLQNSVSVEDDEKQYSEEFPVLQPDNMDYEILLNFIRELPDGYRMVFNLYEIEGYSYEEISKMLNCSQANCRSQLLRAKRLLRKKITEFEQK